MVITPFLWMCLTSLVLLFGWMVILYVIATLQSNMGIVDVGWGIGFVLVALVTLFLGDGDLSRRLLLFFVVALWGLRLSFHLGMRYLRSENEDLRYATLRASWIHCRESKIFLMFLGQGFLILLISLPFYSIAEHLPSSLSLLELIGITVCLLSVALEALADEQLRRFKKHSKNSSSICKEGLWARSRHPNYFFEWTFWIGIALFAMQAPFGLLGLLSVSIMFYLLVFVSGISMTEKALAKTKGEAYKEYQQQVPGFFPKVW